jgi:glyoxylase-like metal-dependent hydrolase (beta-lactamase superfamily II)
VKVHELNCGTMRPRGAGIFAPRLARVPCNCLLLETDDRLVLVDTGLGTMDMDDPGRLGRSNVVLNAQPDQEQTALRRLRRLGLRRYDVSHIICTHLDRDHAGGLADFPDACVHVLAAEREAALNPRGFGEKDRYRACHFEHGPRWAAHTASEASESWFTLECIAGPGGLPPEIIMVPLPGHTRGHCGVAIDTGDGWLFHCGDAFYNPSELGTGAPAPLDIRCFRRIAHEDFPAAMGQIERIRQAVDAAGGKVRTLAAHDPGGFAGE